MISRQEALMRLVSSAFEQGQQIPRRFTCEGENISPAFSWEDAPKEAKEFALILHDPDAPGLKGFTHWLLYGIPPTVTRVQENIPKEAKVANLGLQGLNDAGKVGYTGPCPPSGTHRYFARLYALRKEIGLKPGANAQEVKAAIENIVIEGAELMGTYAKQQVKTAY
jgi:Raf kinase inhibitor-like YbhB/YbcL family protein